MEPTSTQPYRHSAGSSSSHSDQTSPVDPHFSTTAAHATGDTPYPTASPAQPAAGGVQGKVTEAVASGKKWLADSGLADKAQQLPQAAKDLGNKALTSINGLTTTQKAVGVGLLAAGIAFLATRASKHKSDDGEYRHRPRRSPFDHQPHTREGNASAPYDRKSQRPWGTSRYGTAAAPAGKSRVTSGSGYTSSPAPHSADHGRTSSDRSTSVGSSSYGGQRRDQGPAAAGSRYDATTSGGQNPNNLGS